MRNRNDYDCICFNGIKDIEWETMQRHLPQRALDYLTKGWVVSQQRNCAINLIKEIDAQAG
jgi:hypothetical protein